LPEFIPAPEGIMTLEAPVSMRAMLAGAQRKDAALLALTRKLVLCESPSDNKEAVDACVALVAEEVKNRDGRVKLHRQKQYGHVLEARFGPRNRKSSEKPLLLLGHLDTVWPVGTLKSMPCRLSEGRLWGPGTLDMKAGAAMALTAMELLQEADLLNRQIVLLLNSEEELGSPISRPITEQLASESSAVYVLESALGLAYKTARKGTGNWRVDVRGIAAHSGVDFARGASAIREVARLVEKISGWTDLERGLTVNAGRIGGGSKTNVVAAEAWTEIDVRLARKADGPRIARRFSALKPTDKRCSLTITGDVNRPPMERTRGTVKLFRQARTLADALGFTLEEAATGGASDGNFTSALGIPTLDGMGAIGEGAHAAHEHIVVEHLAPRTALLAGMIAQE
jgi:glutamate carboxypeptidase